MEMNVVPVRTVLDDQIRQYYYYFLEDDYQNFIFCCSRVLRQHFITCHS